MRSVINKGKRKTMQNIDRIPRVAITHGDTNGIGYELILKTFSEPEILEMMTPVVYGSKMIAAVHAEQLQSECKFNVVSAASDIQEGRLNLVEASADSAPVKFGTPTAESSAMASKSLAKAVSDIAEGTVDVLVLSPATEDELHAVMDMVKEMTDVQVSDLNPISITGNDTLCVASVSGNVDAANVAAMTSVECIVERATTFRNTLRRDMRIDNPRIAILAMGENVDTTEGSNDTTIIAPAVQKLREDGVVAFGPYSAKEMFEEGKYVHFDGILGMYDKQVTVPFKEIFGNRCMIMFGGLPIIMTSVIQDPSFGIAGKGLADETSMRLAIYTAIDAARSRRYYDIPLKNPLGKLYHERREDGDKARFAVKREFKPREEKTEK